MTFQKDDIAYIKNTSFGCTSYDKFSVREVEDGKVYVSALNRPFDAETGHYLGGRLAISLCVTPEQIERAVREYRE